MQIKGFRNLLISSRKTVYIIAVALVFVSGVSYMQAAFIFPTLIPPNPIPSLLLPVNTSTIFQDKAGAFQASTIGVTDGISLNGINRTVAMGWPVSSVMAQCHLESRRVDSIAPRRFYTTDTAHIVGGMYPKCDDYLTPAARAAGWVHSGGDECLGWDSNDCQAVATTEAACVYIRVVCSNGITIEHPKTATSTYVSQPFTVPALQCVDGINNDGDGLVDYPADPQCGSVYDNSESLIRACSDGIANDGDGLNDYPADPGCETDWDSTE